MKRLLCSIFIFWLNFSTVTSANPTCPDGFTLLTSDKCVKLFETPQQYQDAVATCRKIDKGNIISIGNQSQSDGILKLLSAQHSTRPFWIGLICTTPVGKDCYWEDASGTAAVYNSFASSNPNPTLGYNNYMLSSGSSSGKWVSVDGSLAQLNFVCEVPSSIVPDYETCNPSTPTTFLFAYSNDLAPALVLETISYYQQTTAALGTRYSVFASVRFDLQQPEDIFYHTNTSQLLDTVETRLPDSALSYNSTSTGSDIENILTKFIGNGNYPVCGAQVLVLLKRYPNQQINALDYNNRHMSFYVVSHNVPSGGNQPQALYDLATNTKGMCFFVGDAQYYKVAAQGAYFNSYVFYAVNVKSLSVPVALPIMTVPVPQNFQTLNMFTTLDNGPNSAFKSFNFNAYSFQQGYTQNEALSASNAPANSTYYQYKWFRMNSGYSYNMTLSMTSTFGALIQLRATTNSAINFWPPTF